MKVVDWIFCVEYAEGFWVVPQLAISLLVIVGVAVAAVVVLGG